MISINIRDIQHYLYCPHRWGLIAIGDVWAENFYVIKANLQHKNVHDKERIAYSKTKKMVNAVSVFNDDLEIYGVLDALELIKSPNGVNIPSFSGKYELCIVEHKPTAPKKSNEGFNEDDALQVFAQKISLDSTFKTNAQAVLYYANEKKRVQLPFDSQFDYYMEKLQNTLAEMRTYLENNEIPPIRPKQKCSGCSFKDLCMPVLKKQKANKALIYKVLADVYDPKEV